MQHSNADVTIFMNEWQGIYLEDQFMQNIFWNLLASQITSSIQNTALIELKMTIQKWHLRLTNPLPNFVLRLSSNTFWPQLSSINWLMFSTEKPLNQGIKISQTVICTGKLCFKSKDICVYFVYTKANRTKIDDFFSALSKASVLDTQNHYNV